MKNKKVLNEQKKRTWINMEQGQRFVFIRYFNIMSTIMSAYYYI